MQDLVKTLPLTKRERDAAVLASQGKLNKEIAHELFITEGTVKIYLVRVFIKLGIKRRTELIGRV